MHHYNVINIIIKLFPPPRHLKAICDYLRISLLCYHFVNYDTCVRSIVKLTAKYQSLNKNSIWEKLKDAAFICHCTWEQEACVKFRDRPVWHLSREASFGTAFAITKECVVNDFKIGSQADWQRWRVILRMVSKDRNIFCK